MAKGNPEEDVAKQAKVAAALARTEQAQLRVAIAAAQLGAAQAAAAAQAEAASARASAAAEKSAAAQAAAAQRASLAQQKAAQDAAVAQQKAQLDYMKGINQILIAKQKADDATAASAAKAAAAQAKAANDAAVAQAKVAAAQAKVAATVTKAGASATAAAAPTGALADQLQGLASSATSLGGPLGQVQSVLASLGPEGMAAAAVLGVMTIAITATVGALWEMSKAAYAVIDQRDDWITLFDALGSGPGAGAKTLAMIDKVAKDLPFATSKIADWAKSLMAAGVAEKDLESSVKAVAAATALMGEQGGQAAETMIKRLAEGGEAAKGTIKAIQEGGPKAAKLLAEMGLNSADLAKAMNMTPEAFAKAKISAEEMRKAIEKALQQKGAGALENMMGDMPVILMKVREGFLSLFEGLGKPMGEVMAAVQALFKNFYKGGAVIAALKPIVTSVFTTLFSWATVAINAVRGIVNAFTGASKAGSVLGGALAVLKGAVSVLGVVFGYIGDKIKLAIPYLVAFFSNATVLKVLRGIFTGIAVALVVIGAVIAVVGGAFLAVGAVIFGVIGAAAAVIGGLVGTVVGVVEEIVGALSGLGTGASEAGSNFIAGLVSGIEAGAGAVVAAVTGLAQGALSAFQGVLGIHSESRVLKKHGKDNMAGAVGSGIDAGAGKVDDAMSRLGADAAKGAPSRSSSRGGKVINFYGPITIGSRDDLDAFEEKMFSVMDRGSDESPAGAPA